MDDEEYFARVAFLKHGTVPGHLHSSLRVSWKQQTKKQYCLDYITKSSGQEAILLVQPRKSKQKTTSFPKKFVLRRSKLEETLKTIHEPYHIERDAMLFEV